MKLILNDTGFAGMTPLHEAVLFGPPEDVQRWAARSEKNERNSLGQTPLHLAVSKPHHLQAILNAGHNPDAVDGHGMTPLMYAAASDEIDAARILIRAGADPFVQHSALHFTFTQFAITRSNWDFIRDLFYFFDHDAMQTMAEMLSKQVVSLLFLDLYIPWKTRKDDCLLQMISRCKSLNFCVEEFPGFDSRQSVKGRTLLHYAHTAREVDALLDRGFNVVNQVDQNGQHALMSAISRTYDFDLEPLVGRLLDAGAEINLQDRRGHTAYHIMIDRFSNENPYATEENIDSLHTLVARGAGVLIPDNCRCSCSVSGCLPVVMDRKQELRSVRAPTESSSVLLTEWIILLFETCGMETAKQALLATIRRAEHKKLDMTHTCCMRATRSFYQDPYPEPMPEDDIDDILEEEAEFMRILDETMDHESEREFSSLLQSAILNTKPHMDETGNRLWSTENRNGGMTKVLVSSYPLPSR